MFDVGAVGNGKREADITKETVRYLLELLKKQGHEVIDVTPYNEKFTEKKSHHEKRCKAVDNFKADIYLDIHVNAGGGTGAECWVYSKTSKAYPYAEKICKSISENLGLKNRGVKINPTFWSLSLCKAPAVIVEGAFIDNEYDMKKLDPKSYAESVAMVFGEVEKMEEKDKPSDWAKDAWEWGKKNGITDGSRPKDNTTREEVITMLYRFKEVIK